MKPCSGTIFQIQRWSVNDGEGIRSTVFFKGCPLRCKWCANPESWKAGPEVLFFAAKCSGCGLCAQVCKTGAATMGAANISALDRTKCIACFQCCNVCPTGARKSMGSVVTVEEVLLVINRDAVFYRESGGGVTFSGGEPFAQPEFLRQLVAACNRQCIDTAVETCGHYSWEPVKDIFAQLDCVFVDIKHMDDETHRRLTGVGNRRILDNIVLITETNPNTIVRVPLIADINDDEQNIRKMCDFLRQKTRVAGVELLPYHDFGATKYNAVGAASQSFSTPDTAKIERLKHSITSYGLRMVDFK